MNAQFYILARLILFSGNNLVFLDLFSSFVPTAGPLYFFVATAPGLAVYYYDYHHHFMCLGKKLIFQPTYPFDYMTKFNLHERGNG